MWDAEFVKVNQAMLFDLILAENYLNIKNLLDLTCQTVADMIKQDFGGDLQDIQYQERLHPRGGGGNPPRKPVGV
ncbi:hypothetical protein HN51_069692 [Arachis hypogaea]